MDYLVPHTTLTSIADAIRSKTGRTNKMTVFQMPSEIDAISFERVSNVNMLTTRHNLFCNITSTIEASVSLTVEVD